MKTPHETFKETGSYVEKPLLPRHKLPPVKYFRVRIKTVCSACPFTGRCKQCSGKGWYYSYETVSEQNIAEIK